MEFFLRYFPMGHKYCQNYRISRLEKLQDRALRIINFSKFNEHRNPIYLKFKILKFNDHIKVLNFLFVHDCINNNIPMSLCDTFVPANKAHKYPTRNADNTNIVLPKAKTTGAGLNSIKYQSTSIWNSLNSKFTDENFHDRGRSYCKNFITNYLLQSYS